MAKRETVIEESRRRGKSKLIIKKKNFEYKIKKKQPSVCNEV